MGDQTELLNHLADVHDIRFESTRRQRALERVDARSATSVLKVFSFVHADVHEFNKTSSTIHHKTSYEKLDRNQWRDETKQPQAQEDNNVGDLVEQKMSTAESKTRSDHQSEMDDLNDCVVEQDHPANDNGVRTDLTRLKTVSSNCASTSTWTRADQTYPPKVPSVYVVVPPVPDSWKDVPQIDEVNDDVESLSIRGSDRPKASRVTSRGRPRGSRNRRTLRQERRRATLAKTRSSSSDELG